MRFISCLGIGLLCFLVILAPGAYATHPGAGDAGETCAHTHYGRLHSLCADGVKGTACTVNGEVGQCVQTEVACLCQPERARVQEFLFRDLERSVRMILDTAEATETLGQSIACSQMHRLVNQMSSALLGLEELGSFDFINTRLLRGIDSLLRKLDTVDEAMLTCFAGTITTVIKNLRRFLLEKKIELIKAYGTLSPQ
ncbi:MAG: hypothetical protein D6736_06355 [Nitrospinota bacterium]|nr:MAG: hypothetical protein D6736_06355 [Nitrospinota bacterium]